MLALFWVGIGGFLGACSRYLLGGWVAQRLGIVFPYGTFVINITGSFILGFFMAFGQDRAWVNPGLRLFFAVGFLGAYTTFSTFEYESVRLIQEGELLLAIVNLVGSVLAGGIAALSGIALGIRI